MNVTASEMIVGCPECGTKFKLDPERIKGETATVRCSRCRHIFPVHRPEAAPQEDVSPRPPREVMGPAPAGKRRRRLWLPILLISLLCTAGAVVVWLRFPWSHAHQPAPENVGIYLLHLVETKGYFIENAKAGQVFVIEGSVRNDFPLPRRWILLRAKLYTTDGREVRQQLFYAGNLLSREQVQSLTLADQLGRIQQTPQGAEVAIRPGQEVAFIVPFGDLPDLNKLGDYSVEIVASQSS
jgi:predicted Zn finger-like uncharacterized protein